MLYEAKLSTKKRNGLSDEQFGLPDDRKYPLNDKDHVKLAIRFFNYCDDNDRAELASNINDALKRFKMKVNVGAKNKFREYINPEYLSEANNGIIFDPCEKIPDEYLDVVWNSLKKQIYIINSDTDNQSSLYNMHINQYMSYETNPIICMKLKKILDNIIDYERLDIAEYTTVRLDKIDLLKLSTEPLFKKIFYMPIADTMRSVKNKFLCTFVVFNDTDLMYILKHKNQDSIYTCVSLTDDLLSYALHETDNCPSYVKACVLEVENSKGKGDTKQSVEEAVSLNANGDVTVSIGKTKSYMDEYSEVHRILIENDKHKNFKAMKSNLAFLFALISIIERDPKYKRRDPEVVKARAFAMNDFKTYLTVVQNNEPSFDFAEYYKSSNYDKTIINIPRTTILGIKKLLKTIFM